MARYQLAQAKGYLEHVIGHRRGCSRDIAVADSIESLIAQIRLYPVPRA